MIDPTLFSEEQGDAFQHTLQPKMLRAYFAAQAMQGMLANCDGDALKKIPKAAVFMADALIAELEKVK